MISLQVGEVERKRTPGLWGILTFSLGNLKAWPGCTTMACVEFMEERGR